MCGRYIQMADPERLCRAFGVDERPNLAARYNIAPTQTAPVVRLSEAGGRTLVQPRWGLIPHWARDAKIGNSLINARAETVATKPAFRDSFRDRRCLVPADGFYEWRQEGGVKQPYLIRLADGGLFAFAGLWSRWRDPEGTRVESYTIVTTSPNELIAPLHNRMAAVLDPADYDAWLTGDAETALAAIRPYPAEAMMLTRVSTKVNSPRNDGPELIESPPTE